MSVCLCFFFKTAPSEITPNKLSSLISITDHRNNLNLDSEQIAALSEYIPSEKEKIALSPYLSRQVEPGSNRVSGCEKWMIAISSVQDAGEKLRSMCFMADPALLEHLQSGKSIVERAADRPSLHVKLRGI